MTTEEKSSPVNSRQKFPGNDCDDGSHVLSELTPVGGLRWTQLGSCVPLSGWGFCRREKKERCWMDKNDKHHQDLGKATTERQPEGENVSTGEQ